MDRRMRWVRAVLVAYAVGFLLYPPRVLLIIDELGYVSQAVAFAKGALTIPGADPIFPPSPLRTASNYPPGTALLQAPFVAIAGWRGATALSALSLILATLITARWLRDSDYDPRFALLIPGFIGALFFGRVAMSDVPSVVFVAAALWLLWRAENGDWRWSAAAGFVGGASLLLREPNVVLLAPVFVGAIVRRKCVVWALIAGGLAGLALRLGISREMFGSTLYVRDSGYGFSLRSAGGNLPVYAAILLLLFPLGALLPFFYRGPRRAEVVTAIAIYSATFLFYDYNSARENGVVKGLLLTSRFIIPALPLLALMAADVYPRWFHGLPERASSSVLKLRPAALALLALVAFAIHPVLRRQESEPVAIVAAIHERTSESVPIITNHQATLKYLSPVYGERRLILRSYITPTQVPRFYRELGKLNVVFLDRTDSEMFRADAVNNDRFLAELRSRCALDSSYDAPVATSMRLRVFTVTGCS